MALIICSECGKEFSDKAPACPNCGCPIQEILTTNPVEIPYELHYTDPNHLTIDIKNNYVTFSHKGKIKKEGHLKDLVWTDYKDPGTVTYGGINLSFPSDFIGTFLTFKKTDIHIADELKKNVARKITEREILSDEKAIKKAIKAQEKNRALQFRCPKCNSINITIANTKSKTTLNLNPLKPFTLVNHKATEESWLCHDCGLRWGRKVK